MLQNTNGLVGILFHDVEKQQCCLAMLEAARAVSSFEKVAKHFRNGKNPPMCEKTPEIQAVAE